MKSYNHLFEKLIDYNNLEKALMNASLGKRHREDVKTVLADKDFHIKQLQKLLITKTLEIRQHTAVEINDGISRKKRIIIKPDFIYEQILHHAIVQVMQPIIMKGMYQYSCGSIPKRGVHYGKKHIEKYIQNNKSEIKYICKADIQRFFPSVDTKLLKEKCRKIIHDERMLWVLNMVIDSNTAIHNGTEINLGLPIGFYTSQWFANWFLQDLDHFIKEDLKVKCYVRYIDDIVMFGKNKKELHKKLEEIKKFLAKKNLKIKQNYQVFRFVYTDRNGKERGRVLDYMGFQFYRNKTILRKSIMIKATRKARRMFKKKTITWYDCTQILSYMGYFLCTNTYKVYEKYIKPFVDIKKCKKIISTRQHKINRRTENAVKLERIRKLQPASQNRQQIVY